VDLRHLHERIFAVVALTGASTYAYPQPPLFRMRLTKIASDQRVLKALEKGKVKKDDIEEELKKYRKDFKFEKEGGRP
jgi:hypothetical protein